MKGVDATAREITGLLDRLGMPYAIMGGLAVRVPAIPRPTFDVDFTVAAARDDLPTLYRDCEALGYVIPETQRTGWIDSVRGMAVVKLQLPFDDHFIDIDLFLAETPFQQSLLARRQQVAAGDWSAWFVTAEDLILLKLLADRPKDRIDVTDTLFIQGPLNIAYMRHWALMQRWHQSICDCVTPRTSAGTSG
jgi:hypothetical protein